MLLETDVSSLLVSAAEFKAMASWPWTHFKALPIFFLFAFEKAFPQEGQQILQLSLPEWEFALLFLFLFHSPK